MSVIVKICGITNLDDALDAVDCGADWLGFNFYPDSPRYLEPEKAKEIILEIPPSIEKVGVFVNAQPEWVIDITTDLNLDRLQFHGDETPEFCNSFGRAWYKAFRFQTESELKQLALYECDWVLADTYVEKAFGGTGVVSNWDLARKAGEQKKLILSGGLKPENIEIALEAVKPQAVDVASGVETSPGIKDRYKMEELIKRVKKFGK